MHRLTLALALALASACTGTATVGYSEPVAAEASLVEVQPNVYVVENYDEPVFYSDNFYWRFYGGTWYRSTYHTGGWAVARPPSAVLRIQEPHRYVRYHARANDRVVVRDRRGRVIRRR